MGVKLERKQFHSDWRTVLLFLVLVTLPTFWPVLFAVETRLQAAIGTALASAVIGLIGWWFIRREGVGAEDVGLGRRAWTRGLALFLAWWVLVTLVDLAGRWIAGLLDVSLPPIGNYEWTLATVAELVSAFIFVAFAEEIAFRGYLHNKLVAEVGRRWLAILLAALAFGLWHTPADIAGSGQVLSPFLNALLFALVGLVFFHLPYEWTGLLPFLALFHGWNDFLLLPTLEAPTAVGAAAGYVLMWVVLWAGGRLSRRHAAAARAGSQAGM